MIFPLITQASRPNRYEVNVKDENYHRDFARFYLSQANNPVLLDNMFRGLINYNFYKGNKAQWIFKEDLAPFLMEETGDPRNRVKWEYNFIRNLVRTFMNNTARSTFEVRAYNISERNMKAMDKELSMRLQAHQMSEAMPRLKQRFKASYNLGDSPEETETNFYDEVGEKTDNSINAIFRSNERKFQIMQWKKHLAKHKCLGGFVSIFDWYEDGEQTFDMIDFAHQFYDINAIKPDLSDAEYCGHITFSFAADILERNPGLTPDEKRVIESQGTRQNAQYWDTYMRMAGYPTNRLPIMMVTWMDLEVRNYGFGNFMGKPSMIRLDNIDRTRLPELLNPNHIPRELMGKAQSDGTLTIEKQIPRYCKIIPHEFIEGGADIVLDYGEVPYAISRKESSFLSSLPYHFDTYDYNYGEMLTPCDPVIDVQRIVNRFISMMEETMNNNIGSSVFIDNSLLTKDGRSSKAIGADMRGSKVIGVDGSRFGGIQNSIIPYSGQAAIQQSKGYLEIVQSLYAMGQNTTSVNNDMMGANKNPRQLVGVQENNIEQGFAQQGDFVDGIGYLYYKLYWSMANKGRRILCDNEAKLIDTIGGAMAQVFKFTKNMISDDIYIALRRVPPEQTNIDYVNGYLFKLLGDGRSPGMIGPKQFARLFNRTEMDDVSDAIREYQAEQIALSKDMQAEKSQQDQDAEAKQMQMLQLQLGLTQKAQDHEDNLQDKKNDGQLMRDLLKAHQKLIVEKMKQRNSAGMGK